MALTRTTTPSVAAVTASVTAESAFVLCPIRTGNGMAIGLPMAMGHWQMAVYAEAYRRAWESIEARKRAQMQARIASCRIGREVVFSAGTRP